MTTPQHPITPPPELVHEWRVEWFTSDRSGSYHEYVSTRAAQWGADQELEACCEWLETALVGTKPLTTELRAARRPKLPSLAEEAIEAARIELTPTGKNGALIIKALKRLQQLEEQQ